MRDLVGQYEEWFQEGNRDLRAFLKVHAAPPAEARDVVLVDQYLRHQSGDILSVDTYVRTIDLVAEDESLQIELWCEAYGYLEESNSVTASTREAFLADIPESLRETVSQEIGNALLVPVQFDQAPEIERYRVEAEVGRGMFGIVYRAWDNQLQRPVALKVIHACGANQALFSEARIVAKLDDPGIISVFDCGFDAQGRTFIVTSLLEGVDLAKWAEEVGREPSRILACFGQLCRSLDTAHEAGIVHRDLKPSNLIIRPGDRPCILDFGLALADWNLGRSGELVGTPAYMSPEQARGEGHRVDPRSDVFSVGILLIEALTGMRPWRGQTSSELLQEVSEGAVIPVSELSRQTSAALPLEIQRICSKATAASMSDRYESIQALAEDIEWYLELPHSQHANAINPKVANRGLRPYSPADAEGFWALLPGQRDARGVPDSARWWLERLALSPETDSAKPVLVLYGPSGSGKSSLMQAGVMPHLPSTVQCVHLDMSDCENLEQLTRHAAREISGTNSQSVDARFSNLCRNVRDGHTAQKYVLLLDQFEQAFTWADRSAFDDLVQGLRFADGCALQFILVVRDEFWSATSQLMHAIDQPLRDGRNATGLEKFGPDHASSILRLWHGSQLADHFIQEALSFIEEDRAIVPVRLALLGTLLDDVGWTASGLQTIRRYGTLGNYFLSTAIDEADRQQRLAGYARLCMRALTPATGKLRGSAVRESQLASAMAVPSSEGVFSDVIDWLDRQLHLLTPTDVGGPEPAYQLAHDFWVPEVRAWLERHDRATVGGRAASDLREWSKRWQADPTRKNLAGPMDCVRLGLMTSPQTPTEQRFVRASAKRQLLLGTMVVLVAAMLAGGVWWALKRAEGEALVSRIATSSVADLTNNIEDARRQIAWTHTHLQDELAFAQENDDVARVDRLALATLTDTPESLTYLLKRLFEVDRDMRTVILNYFREDLGAEHLKQVQASLATVMGEFSETTQRRLCAAEAMAALAPEHPIWQEHTEAICKSLVELDPTQLGGVADGLQPVRHHLVLGLQRIHGGIFPDQTRTSSFLLAKFARDDQPTLVTLLEDSTLEHLSAVSGPILSASDKMDEALLDRFDERLAEWRRHVSALESGQLPSEPSPRLARPHQSVPEDGAESMAEAKRRLSLTTPVVLANRLGNLAALLLARGQKEAIQVLASSSDPTARNFTIEAYASAALPAQPLCELLCAVGPNSSFILRSDLPEGASAAVLQILGSLPPSTQIPKHVQLLTVQTFQAQSGGELHASAEYFLKRHGLEADPRRIDSLTNDRPEGQVYVTTEGQVMVRLPGGTQAMVGSHADEQNRLANEDRHEVEVPQTIFFSRHELSHQQLARFRESTGSKGLPLPPALHDRAAMRIGFFEAAAYCNWLSEREGIDESQWCYLPNENGVIASGMEIAEDHLERSGYQMPTPDLWEYACRGGTLTPRPYGYGMELSSESIRWSGNRFGALSSVQVRKPNGFGLCDMLGHSAEWTVGLVAGDQGGPPPPNRAPGELRPRLPVRPPNRRMNGMPGLGLGGGPRLISAAGKTIRENCFFAVLGGAFDSPAHKVRSADRSIISPPITNKPLTLRLMRIVPTSQ